MKTAKLVKYKTTGRPAIRIEFPFRSSDVYLIKTLEGRKWYTKEKCWGCPLTASNVIKLADWGFILDDRLKRYYAIKTNKETTSNKSIPLNIPKISKIKGLNGKLFPYQQEGVGFFELKNGRALLADEMGLGKTVQVLAWLQYRIELRPVVIICPASLKENWASEIKKWMSNQTVEIVSGTKPYKLNKFDIIIINYDIIPNWMEYLLSMHISVYVFDESHYLKNIKTIRTKTAKKLTSKIKHILALSGTPILNRPSEIFTIVQMLSPGLFKNKWSFLHRYCNAKFNGFGWDFNGASNIEELNGILANTIMLRRLKADVLTDLPDKMYAFVELPITNKSEYLKAETDFIAYVSDKFDNDFYKLENNLKKNMKQFTKLNNISDVEDIMESNVKTKLKNERLESISQAEYLVQLTTLRQLAVQGKLDAAIEWITNFIESGEKLVVMCIHKFVIDALIEKFGKIAVKIDGSVSLKKRNIAVQQFQTNKKIKLFIGNIQAAGVGITLTAASNIVLLEFPWTPGELNQAIDRVHRIGQISKVTAWYLVATSTVDSKFAKILYQKQQICNGVLDGQKVKDNNMMSQLWDELTKTSK